MGLTNCTDEPSDTFKSIGNIFTAGGNEVLKAVSVISTDPNSVADIQIYKVDNKNNPVNGKLVYQKKETIPFGGYHVINLDRPIQLQEGEMFSVVETIYGASGYMYPVEYAIGYPLYGYDTYVTSSQGESFCKFEANTPWVDLTNKNASTNQLKYYDTGNVCIKAFTVDSDETEPVLESLLIEGSDINKVSIGGPLEYSVVEEESNTVIINEVPTDSDSIKILGGKVNGKETQNIIIEGAGNEFQIGEEISRAILDRSSLKLIISSEPNKLYTKEYILKVNIKQTKLEGENGIYLTDKNGYIPHDISFTTNYVNEGADYDAIKQALELQGGVGKFCVYNIRTKYKEDFFELDSGQNVSLQLTLPDNYDAGKSRLFYVTLEETNGATCVYLTDVEKDGNTLEYLTNAINGYYVIAEAEFFPEIPKFDSEIIYSPVKTLNDIVIPEVIGGRWKWSDPAVVPSVEQEQYSAVFEPEDSSGYRTCTVNIKLKINPAIPVMENLTIHNLTYGQKLNEIEVQFRVLCDGINVDGKIKWNNNNIYPIAGSDEHSFVFYPDDMTNYDNVEGIQTVNVDKKDITVYADPAYRTYGSSNPLFDFHLADGDSLVGSDIKADLGVELSCAADKRSAINDYPITGNAVSDNYNVTVVPSTLTVKKRPISIKPVDTQITYGEQIPLDYDFTVKNLSAYDDKSDIQVKFFVTADQNSLSGIYVISGTAEADNYDVTVKEGILTIKEAELLGKNNQIVNNSSLPDEFVNGMKLIGNIRLNENSKAIVSDLDLSSKEYKAYQNGVKVSEEIISMFQISLKDVENIVSPVTIILPVDSRYNEKTLHVMQYLHTGELDHNGVEIKTDKLDRFNDYRVENNQLSLAVYQLNSFAVINPRAVPSYYNLTDLGQTTTLKKQGSFNTGWAFSAIAAIESNVLKQQGASGSEEKSTPDYSERHLAWFAYQQTDGEGLSGANGITGNEIYNLDGGYFKYNAAQVLSTWAGVESEIVVPYSDDINQDLSVNNSLRYDSMAHLVHANYLDSTAKFEKNYYYDDEGHYHPPSGYYFDAGAADTVKEMIEKYGAVTSRARISNLNSKTGACYSSSYEGAMDDVTIVGWDDTYSKENFLSECRPEQDGAWIVKCSREDFAQEGYIYLSYYDYNIKWFVSYQMELPDEDGNFKYDHNYQYDFLGMNNTTNQPAPIPVSVANIFTAKGREILGAVSVFTLEPNSWVDIEVYKVDSTVNPVDGELVSKHSTEIAYAGYHIIDLNQTVSLDKGQKFSVVLTVKGKNGYVDAVEIGYATALSNTLINVKSLPGQSFISYNDRPWTDLTDKTTDNNYFRYYDTGNALIKAFTYDIKEKTPELKAFNFECYDCEKNIIGSTETYHLSDETEKIELELPARTAFININSVELSDETIGKAYVYAGQTQYEFGEFIPYASFGDLQLILKSLPNEKEQMTYPVNITIPKTILVGSDDIRLIDNNSIIPQNTNLTTAECTQGREYDSIKNALSECSSQDQFKVLKLVLNYNGEQYNLEEQQKITLQFSRPETYPASNTVLYYAELRDGGVLLTDLGGVGKDDVTLETETSYVNGFFVIAVAKQIPQIPQINDKFTYSPVNTLKNIKLPEVPGGKWNWDEPELIPTVSVKEYAASFVPYENSIYKPYSANIQIILERAVPQIRETETTNLTYGQKLKETNLRGKAFVDNTEIEGSVDSWYLIEGDTVPKVGNSMHSFIFTPKDTINYAPAEGTVSVSVGRKLITAYVEPATKLYGDKNPEFSIKVPEESLVLNDKEKDLRITLKCMADETSHVGEYEIIGSSYNNNYKVSIISAMLTVKKRPIILFPKPVEITYGDNIPTNFDFTISGLVNKDKINVVRAALYTDATSNSKVGTYKILGKAEAADYEVEVRPGTLTIKKALSEDKVKAFVKRLYSIVLQREADKSGLEFYVNNLLNKKTNGAAVAYGFISSDEFKQMNLSEEEYIKILYSVMMDRMPDKGGLDYYKKLLDNGVSRDFIFKGFVESEEYKNLCKESGIESGTIVLSKPKDQNPNLTMYIFRLYDNALERKPDEDGINFYCSQLQLKKMTPVQAAQNFIFSPEFINKNLSDADYVKVLYRTFMGREYDQNGLSYHLDRIKSGVRREEILFGFAYSPEFKNIMAGFGL